MRHLALALTLLAGTASAALAAEPTSTTRSVLSIDDTTYEVVTKDGQLTSVSLNGEQLPPSRYTIDNDHVVIRDEQGNTLARVAVGLDRTIVTSTPDHAITGTLAARARGEAEIQRLRASQLEDMAREQAKAAEVMTKRAVAIARRSEQPKVMLGVTFNAESNTEDGVTTNTLTITRVGPGLPAERAGLQPNDQIILIDGVSNPSSDTLSQALARKNPGDTLTLRVRRDGSERDVTITLDAYNADQLSAVTASQQELAELERLEALRGIQGADPHNNLFRWYVDSDFDADAMLDDMTARLDELLARHDVFDKIHSSREELMNEVRAVLQDARDAVAPVMNDLHQHFLRLQSLPGNDRLIIRPAPPVPPTPPQPMPGLQPMPTWEAPKFGAPAAADAQATARLTELENKVEQLDTKLDRLLELLEERKHSEH
jgi:type II secretory pathway component PulC